MIWIDNITKRYPGGVGIFDIDLKLENGQVVSVIGPNGAGKSTFLNVLSGKISADKGRILEDGVEIGLTDRRARFGFMPDYYDVSATFTAWELLNLVSDLRYSGNARKFILEETDKVGLAENVNKKVSQLSLGNKKKLAMLIAFMGESDTVLLDEPTNGIDAEGVIYLKEKIEEFKTKGRSMVISSHILDFVDSVCDYHYFMKNGRIVYQTEKRELENIYKSIFMENKQ